MPENDGIPKGQDGPDDHKWNMVFDDAFVRGATVKEPSAPVRKRVWPRNAALVLSAAAVTLIALKLTNWSSDGATPPATAASASATPPSSAATATVRPMIPLAKAFPAHVPDGLGGTFTKVGAAVLKSCTESDSVGPALAADITQSKGCVGEEIALYKDAQNDQFNLAIFTMKDPLDTVKLVTRLTMAFGDYEVAAQAPPPGSGLRVLPADSGMVQSFTGQGRAMVAGLAQWSDGRVGDYQKLDDRLEPLLKAVSKNVGRYESAN